MILDYFEKFMRASKYFILLAVFTSILSSIFLFFWSFLEFINIFLKSSELNVKYIIINMITTMDVFLLGIISLIFSWSMYELYVRDPNEHCSKKQKVSRPLIVYNLDELKEKLSKIIIIMLIITFFKYSLYFEYKNIYELLMFAISILLISLGIFFTTDKKR